MRAWILLPIVCVATGCATAPEPVVVKEPFGPPAPEIAMTQDFAIPVLMYHRVCDLTPEEAKSPILRDLSVSPKDFEQQVVLMKQEGFTFLHVSEIEKALIEGKPLPEKAVAITLDDGYRDNFTEAFPILKKYNVKATIFMVTNNFDRPNRLSWSDARTMNSQAVSFQSHTVSHPDLTLASDEALRHELVESKLILEKGLDSTVTSVAYPAGAFDRRVSIAAEDAGYLAAWKKGGGTVQPYCAANPYELPRIRVHGRTDIDKFRQRLMSGTEILAMRARLADRES
ncbi:MAG: polysaccharide deacetylase family protein [Fimbriimonadaceae bacterium]